MLTPLVGRDYRAMQKFLLFVWLVVSLCSLTVEFQCVCLCGVAYTPTLKRQTGQSLKKQEGQIVVSVSNCIRTENRDESISRLATVTITAASISKNYGILVPGLIRLRNKRRQARFT
jgi:hypothetical protein